MAGDWIKMRPSLMTNPKVNGIARILEDEKAVTKTLSTGYNGVMSEIVTRNVMRYVTVSALLVIWGAANEHTNDGIFKNADLSDIDDMAGIPGFGNAMELVGWAIYDERSCTVTLPNFNEYNTCGNERKPQTNAERQKKYRENKIANSNVNRNASVVTSNDIREDKIREDKIREENKNIKELTPTEFVTADGDSPKRQKIPIAEIVALYHEILPKHPECKKITTKRAGHIRQRWSSGDLPDLKTWRDYFDHVSRSDFLCGRAPPTERYPTPFRADIDFLINESNYTKIYEGKYHGNPRQPSEQVQQAKLSTVQRASIIAQRGIDALEAELGNAGRGDSNAQVLEVDGGVARRSVG